MKRNADSIMYCIFNIVRISCSIKDSILYYSSEIYYYIYIKI